MFYKKLFTLCLVALILVTSVFFVGCSSSDRDKYQKEEGEGSGILTGYDAARNLVNMDISLWVQYIDGEDISDRAMFIKDRFKDLDIKYCDVKIVKDDDNEITVIADEFLPYAVIDVPYLLEDNCFVLKKGEMKTIKKIKGL